MDLSKVRELVKLVEDSMIDELEVIDKDTTIRIQKHGRAAATVLPATPVAVAPVEGAVVAATPTPAAAEVNPERAKWREIRSPIVGTFYRAPSPEAAPFVSVGDTIRPGQTLCIVEAMKVMNEIEAEIGGVVREILAENGSPIEAEAVLFLVDPA